MHSGAFSTAAPREYYWKNKFLPKGGPPSCRQSILAPAPAQQERRGRGAAVGRVERPHRKTGVRSQQISVQGAENKPRCCRDGGLQRG